MGLSGGLGRLLWGEEWVLALCVYVPGEKEAQRKGWAHCEYTHERRLEEEKWEDKRRAAALLLCSDWMSLLIPSSRPWLFCE